MERRVVIRWTTTAKNQLAELPRRVRKGILAKADGLLECTDPRRAYEPLHGPLEGYYRLTYARYRAVYTVEEETRASGEVVLHVAICFVAVGKRKQRDKKDIYRIAEKIVDSGVLDIDTSSGGPLSDSPVP